MALHDELRDLVLSGALDTMDRVTEADLASRLGVSRTPVREALQRLESEGLVRAQGRGVRVRVLLTDELFDVFTARAGLEGWAVCQAARRVAAGEVAPARLAALDVLAEQAHDLTTQGDLRRGAEANRAFHEAVAGVAESAATSEALRRWWDQITVSTRRSLRSPDRVEMVHAEHREILRALRAGDPNLANVPAGASIWTFGLFDK